MIWIDDVLVSPGPAGVYGEKTLQGYRVWDPARSKMAAFCHLGGVVDLTRNQSILYLGAANGTTVSHVADYTGTVYAVEFAARPMRDLLEIARKRKNIVPIMGDARLPEEYAPFVEPVDLIYMDIAQPDQVPIVLRNTQFLKTGGSLILMLKTRSIDTTRVPEDLCSDAVRELSNTYRIDRDPIWLTQYHVDHVAITGTKL
ncbi:MAG: fibrillarin-like rRNA/tRNA 2'-O-methyltransferase [Methanoregulaceae archaeon]